MLRFRATVVAACIAALALAGCGSSGGGGVDEARVAALSAERDAARMALEALRESLETAQESLAAATNAGQRGEARQAVTEARADLAEVRRDLAAQDDSEAKTAATDALAAVDTALALTVEALAAPAAASGGVVAPANMHTTLDRAQTALDDAQAKLKTALAAGPSAAVRGLLSQAQATLSTAQVSLVPLLRRELADAETEAAAQRARAEAERDRAAAEKERADREKARADAEKARADSERESAEAERDSERERAAAEKARADRERERAEAEKARADRERERAEAEKARADAAAQYNPRVSLADALAPRAPGFVPRGEAQITRTPRTDTGEAGWAKLDIRTAPVPWAEGSKVGADGGLVATRELPLRSVTLYGTGNHPLVILGDDGTPAAYSETDSTPTGSLRLSTDGGILQPTMKFGGEGVVRYDLQRRFESSMDEDSWSQDGWKTSGGPDGKAGFSDLTTATTMLQTHVDQLAGVSTLPDPAPTLTQAQVDELHGYAADNPNNCAGETRSLCGDWIFDDVTVAFGAASQSPHGDPSWHWKAKVPLTPEQRQRNDEGELDDEGLPLPTRMRRGHADYDGRPVELGTWELWLSNHAGIVRGADTEDTSDDRHAYLDYAAYGLFMFFDNVTAIPSWTRPQAFAFGYDAFEDAENLRTTDVATSIAATFRGRTMARALNDTGPHRARSNVNLFELGGATPLQGDIELNACIGASACTGDRVPNGANTISGMISNLEILRDDGVWVSYLPAAGGIPMAPGTIDAAGSFAGALQTPQLANSAPNGDHFDADATAKYAGNLYGPRDGMEAAGWWHLRRDWVNRATHGPIIGSFGARCVEGCE